MYLCYIDESGTPEVPGTTTHFVLAGIAIPIWHWHDADREVINILRKYGLEQEELHTAWILRKYLEQSRIANFDDLNWQLRRSAVERERSRYLLQLQKSQRHATYQQGKLSDSHAHIPILPSKRENLSYEKSPIASPDGDLPDCSLSA